MWEKECGTADMLAEAVILRTAVKPLALGPGETYFHQSAWTV
jgi:hypothetical protein